MELLDFAGPTEVFSSTDGFNVYSVSVDGQPLECNQTGKILNKIVPDYSIENAPSPDIIIFPGGGTGRIAKNQKVIDWVKTKAADGTFLMSVCTGASILANTGLLAGKNVTTWFGFIPTLQASHPELKVLENTRFVDNGIFLTTAGVSAGIDGALHLVSRIKGLDVAKGTSKYMEYDKWNPENGRIDVTNEYIEQLRTQAVTPEKIINALPQGSAIPYEGEFKNLAFEFRDKGMNKEAAFVMEACIKLYPKSTGSYVELAKLYKKLGRPAPTDEESLIQMMKDGKMKEAIAQFDKDKVSFPNWINVKHGGALTLYGIDIFQKGDYSNALKVFRLIAIADPKSYGAFYNVGETFMNMGNVKESINSYKKALELKPNDDEIKNILAELEAKL
jgi:putative intracellular protease/amidase